MWRRSWSLRSSLPCNASGVAEPPPLPGDCVLLVGQGPCLLAVGTGEQQMRHREDADNPERERDPLPTTASVRETSPLTCGFAAFDAGALAPFCDPPRLKARPKRAIEAAGSEMHKRQKAHGPLAGSHFRADLRPVVTSHVQLEHEVPGLRWDPRRSHAWRKRHEDAPPTGCNRPGLAPSDCPVACRV